MVQNIMERLNWLLKSITFIVIFQSAKLEMEIV